MHRAFSDRKYHKRREKAKKNHPARCFLFSAPTSGPLSLIITTYPGNHVGFRASNNNIKNAKCKNDEIASLGKRKPHVKRGAKYNPEPRWVQG